MDGPSLLSATPVSGPRDLSSAELGRYGLGIVVRRVRALSSAPVEMLNRVYCLFCGIAVDHERPAEGWWYCQNACNAAGTH